MEHDGLDEHQSPDALANRLEGTGLSSATSSTSLASNDTIVSAGQTPPVTPEIIADALAIFQMRNKRQRTISGNANQNTNKKQRPNMGPEAEALYKKARNSLGKVAKHEAMVQGLRRYGGFGEHIVPQIMKVSNIKIDTLTSLSSLTHCNLVPTSFNLPLLLFCLHTQVKNSIPLGMGDDKLCQDWKEIKITCEKNLLRSQLQYAQRVASQNQTLYDKTLSELKTALNDQEILDSCIAAARTCAEVHRTREQQKQMKMWTEALSNYETQGMVRKPRRNNRSQPKRPMRRDNNAAAPQTGPQGWLPRRNNGRQFRRAQRRLPPNPQDTRGRHHDTDVITRTVQATLAAINAN